MERYEQWLQGQPERQAQRVAQRQAAIAQARLEWVGCRVWCEGAVNKGYAWVTGIDDRGFVGLHLEEPPYGFPERTAMQFEVLGSAIIHAD